MPTRHYAPRQARPLRCTGSPSHGRRAPLSCRACRISECAAVQPSMHRDRIPGTFIMSCRTLMAPHSSRTCQGSQPWIRLITCSRCPSRRHSVWLWFIHQNDRVAAAAAPLGKPSRRRFRSRCCSRSQGNDGIRRSIHGVPFTIASDWTGRVLWVGKIVLAAAVGLAALLPVALRPAAVAGISP
jgi:hypothetical protein